MLNVQYKLYLYTINYTIILLTGNNISVAINYASKQYHCTAVQMTITTFSQHRAPCEQSHWLSQMPITRIIGVIEIGNLQWN